MDVFPQHVYSGLVAETLRSLLQEVLVLGFFIVGVGHVNHAVKEPNYFKTAMFRKRILLLCVVMLFVTYMKLTYSVEWALSPENVIDHARENFTNFDRHHAAWMVILLTPIDMLIVICLAGMFLVLARDEFFQPDGTLNREIKQLYVLTGAAHLVTIFWWVLYGLLATDGFGRITDVGYHATFVALHLTGYLVFTRSTSAFLKSENFHVALYSFLVLAVYVTRLWIYIFLYTS